MWSHLGQARPVGSKRRILRRTIELLHPFRRRVLLLAVLIAITATLDLLPALLFAGIVDEMTGDGDGRRITLLGAAAIAMVVASGLLGVLLGYINQIVGQGVMFNLRARLHDHLQRLSVRFFTATRTGEILSRITTDVNAVQQAVTGTFTDFLTNLTTLVVALALMFSLEWRLALLMAAILPLWTYPTMRVGWIQRRLQRQWQEQAAEMSAHLEETLSVSGAMLVKTFGRQDYEAGRLARANETLRSLSIRRLMAGRWFNMGAALFGSLSIIVVYWLGGLSVLAGDVTPGQVVGFAVLTQRVFGPFRGIMRINTTVLSSLALFERIFEYLDLPVEVREKPDAVALRRPRGRLSFERVTFRYTDAAPPAIDEMTFEVDSGHLPAATFLRSPAGPRAAGRPRPARRDAGLRLARRRCGDAGHLPVPHHAGGEHPLRPAGGR